jgi:large subunit ribosomal protein L17
MRHRKAGIKLGRTASHRDAMFRNMVTSLLKHHRIQTTDIKAKELRRWADHVITLAKKGDLHARRMAMAIVREKDVVHKLFETAGERFGAISGGYTRIVKTGRRAGDAAPMSIVELVGPEAAPKKKKKKTRKPAAEAAPAAEAVAKAPEAAEAAADTPAGEADSPVPEPVEVPAAETGLEAAAQDDEPGAQGDTPAAETPPEAEEGKKE